MPAVSILIVAYNSGDLLPRLQACLEGQTDQDFEVILIDNASEAHRRPDASIVQWARRRGRCIQNEANTGFAAANNQAALLARGEWLALLNPDAFPAPDWLANLRAASARHPHVTAFGSTQLMDEDPARLDGAGDVYHAFGIPWRGGYGQTAPDDLADGECFAPCAAAALWRADVFRALGGFEAGFFCYCEDVDLGFRHRLAGGRAVQVANAVVRHVGSASSGRASDFAVFHGNRNRMWTFVRCMPGIWMWLLALPHALATLLLWAQAARRGAGLAYGRAMLAGLAGLGAALRQRRIIQRSRTVSGMRLLGMMTWSPAGPLRRAIVLRRLPPG